MEKPSAAALAAFDAAFPDDSRAVRKKMFGMPAGFINGHMFLGVFADGVVVRLPAARIAEVAAVEGVGPFEPMPGRPWKEYVHANAKEHGGGEALRGWALEALDHVATFAPKVPKPRKPRGG